MTVALVVDVTPSLMSHAHRFEAHAGDDRWTCTCGAWVRVLERGDGTVVALPKAAA